MREELHKNIGKNPFTRRTITLGLIIWVVLSFIIGNVSGFFFQKYLQDITAPKPFASLKIDPIPFPFVDPKNGDQLVRISIINNGTKTIENIFVDYTMLCNSTDTKRKLLATKSSLLPGDSDYLEFEANFLNTSCNYKADPVRIRIYRDDRGKEYAEVINTTSTVCGYCQLNITIFAQNFTKNYTYWYPYTETSIFVGSEIASGYLPYEKAPNKSRLTFVNELRFFPLDFSTPCIRGDWPREDCEEILTNLPR